MPDSASRSTVVGSTVCALFAYVFLEQTRRRRRRRRSVRATVVHAPAAPRPAVPRPAVSWPVPGVSGPQVRRTDRDDGAHRPDRGLDPP